MMMKIPPGSIASRCSFVDIKSHEKKSEYYRKFKREQISRVFKYLKIFKFIQRTQTHTYAFLFSRKIENITLRFQELVGPERSVNVGTRGKIKRNYALFAKGSRDHHASNKFHQTLSEIANVSLSA